MRAFPLPGEGRSFGFYIGPAPNGTARLPRRVAEHTSRPRNPFRSLSDGQRAELLDALADRSQGELRDELVALLNA